MLPDPRFAGENGRFWATVKLVSETIGYSERQKRGQDPKMKVYSDADISRSHQVLDIPTSYCFEANSTPRSVARKIVEYLNFRSALIENDIKPHLMDRSEARRAFEELRHRYPHSKTKMQMNKQGGKKKHPNYLVNAVNLIAESILGEGGFDGNPMGLGIVTDSHGPLRTLCRRMDGAFPSIRAPKLIWEVKEYYGTTTFGSRIADGVYETMLVGEELKDLSANHGVKILHVLFIDDRYTWWSLGRSYLCRLVDMLHIGQVDAIFVGNEVLTEWPKFLSGIIMPPGK